MIPGIKSYSKSSTRYYGVYHSVLSVDVVVLVALHG